MVEVAPIVFPFGQFTYSDKLLISDQTCYYLRMVKIGEAARILGVSIPTLRRWDDSGVLSPAKVGPGGTRYYDLKDLKDEQFQLYEVPTKALLFELLRRAASNGQSEI